jgi:hypothetical protein
MSTPKHILPENYDLVQSQGWFAFIVQLRPEMHALNLDIVRAASMTYPMLAPTIKCLDLVSPDGLYAYEMQKLNGTPLSRLQRHGSLLGTGSGKRLEGLITSFARLMAQCWHSLHKAHSLSRKAREDSPMEETLSMISQCRGKVGSTIIPRLEKLASDLPDAHLRKKATEAFHAVKRIKDYPVVLNHGDLIPSNILVDPNTWKITGLVDWAEAEYLPFGTCLYGLEHLLGCLTPATPGMSPQWNYFDGEAQLRELFWARLIDAVPELRARLEHVRVMRDIGVLLWNGIAWDDGAINRVVNEVDDVEEMTKLRAFLVVS